MLSMFSLAVGTVFLFRVGGTVEENSPLSPCTSCLWKENRGSRKGSQTGHAILGGHCISLLTLRFQGAHDFEFFSRTLSRRILWERFDDDSCVIQRGFIPS